MATVQIQGKPNTEYTCKVKYESGYSEASGLGTKTSDSQGYCSWTWKVGVNANPDYDPTIYISGGGDSKSCTFNVE